MREKEGKHKDALYEALKQACEEYYDYCGSEEFNGAGLFSYESEVIEKAMEFIHGDRVWEAIREMIGDRC